MSRTILAATLVGLLATSLPAQAVQAQQQAAVQANSLVRSAERWVRQLESELDHLEEDLYYQRGNYPAGLREAIDSASRAAAHFRQILRRNTNREHLMRDFEEMDQQVHQLVSRLEQSGDAWLRRQASRIRYPDEQLHYVLRTTAADGQSDTRELLARHAHTLESEAKSLQDLVDRVVRRGDPLRDAVREFAQEAEHFHQVIERGADSQHLMDDFNGVDEVWRGVVDQINRSAYGLYLRRSAQNVNQVHNQIYGLLTSTSGRSHRHTRQTPPQQVNPPQQQVPRSARPAIEFEIPGLGRFRIPR